MFFYKKSYFLRGRNETDNISDKATPVPIPNTAVKLIRVDGIGTQFGAERVDRCRSHPYPFFMSKLPRSKRGFLFFEKVAVYKVLLGYKGQNVLLFCVKKDIVSS